MRRDLTAIYRMVKIVIMTDSLMCIAATRAPFVTTNNSDSHLTKEKRHTV